MSPTHHRSKFTTAYASDSQIKYVAESDRDAEALYCSTECPVVLANAQEIETFGLPRRRERPIASDVLSDRNVLDVQGVSDTANVSDPLVFSDVSDVQASDL